MASFMVDLWESIFTPGPTPTILKATNASFAALQIVLLVLLYLTLSIHFVILSILSAGLWWAINWFAAEVAAAQKAKDQEVAVQQAKSDAAPSPAADAGSDTEVEEAQVVGKKRRDRPADIEPLEPVGELKHRVETPVGSLSQSSVSTEDEWEKVSGSETGKDK